MDTNEIINANTNIRITARRLVATLGAWKSDEARLTAAFETALQNGDIENADDVERIAGLVLA